MILYAAGVPGVLSVEPDKNWESENKDYGGFYFSNLDMIFHEQYLLWLSS